MYTCTKQRNQYKSFNRLNSFCSPWFSAKTLRTSTHMHHVSHVCAKFPPRKRHVSAFVCNMYLPCMPPLGYEPHMRTMRVRHVFPAYFPHISAGLAPRTHPVRVTFEPHSRNVYATHMHYATYAASSLNVAKIINILHLSVFSNNKGGREEGNSISHLVS